MIDQIIQNTISPIFCLSLFTLFALCKEQVIPFGQCKLKKIIVLMITNGTNIKCLFSVKKKALNACNYNTELIRS